MRSTPRAEGLDNQIANGATGPKTRRPVHPPRFGTARVRGTPRSPMTLRVYRFTLRTHCCQANPEISYLFLSRDPVRVARLSSVRDDKLLQTQAAALPHNVRDATATARQPQPPALRLHQAQCSTAQPVQCPTTQLAQHATTATGTALPQPQLAHRAHNSQPARHPQPQLARPSRQTAIGAAPHDRRSTTTATGA